MYTNDADALRREMEGKPPREENPAPRKKRPAPRHRATPGFAKTGSRKPQASERSSILAQAWYDNGTALGFDFPYDVNYFALALQAKVEKDPEMTALLAKGQAEKVERWVAKMIEIWWNPVDKDGNGGYLSGEVAARNAKEYFLGTDWEDLREYARSSLRAAYLLAHGRRVPAPVYPDQKEYRERLQTLRDREAVDAHVRRALEQPEVDPLPQVDEKDRARLRSFVSKRRKK